jgi:hypothetical protein
MQYGNEESGPPARSRVPPTCRRERVRLPRRCDEDGYVPVRDAIRAVLAADDVIFLELGEKIEEGLCPGDVAELLFEPEGSDRHRAGPSPEGPNRPPRFPHLADRFFWDGDLPPTAHWVTDVRQHWRRARLPLPILDALLPESRRPPGEAAILAEGLAGAVYAALGVGPDGWPLPPKESRREERDRFLYEKGVDRNVLWKEIMNEANRRFQEVPVGSITHARKQAISYARKHKLPTPPARP